MSLARAVALLLSVVAVSGCSPTIGDRLDARTADDTATRQVVARTTDSVTLLPASLFGAALGVDYAYTMPHCGALGAIDIDGSFWDVQPGQGDGIDGQPGTWRLVTRNEAVFSTDAISLSLTRHVGPKVFFFCS